jgi:hypothetical protein
LVVSYSRKAFSQTGDGHFSPVAGYHAARDLVLILDTVSVLLQLLCLLWVMLRFVASKLLWQIRVYGAATVCDSGEEHLIRRSGCCSWLWLCQGYTFETPAAV